MGMTSRAPGRGGRWRWLGLAAIPMAVMSVWLVVWTRSAVHRAASRMASPPVPDASRLGPLPPGRLGLPAPFESLRPGMRLDEAGRLLPALAIQVDGPVQEDGVLELEGRTLRRTIHRLSGKALVRLGPLLIQLEGEPPTLTELSGFDLRRSDVPATWGEPTVIAPGTTAQGLHWAGDGVHFVLVEDRTGTFRFTAEPPETGRAAATGTVAPSRLGAWPDRPGLPRALAVLRPGVPTTALHEAGRALDAALGDELPLSYGTNRSVHIWDGGARGRVKVWTGPYGIAEVLVADRSHGLVDALLARWGTGVTTAPGTVQWVDADAGLCFEALRDPIGSRLEVRACWPLARVLGPDPAAFPIERDGLIGADIETLAARYPVVDSVPAAVPRPVLQLTPGEFPTLHLPRDPRREPQRVRLPLNRGRVERLELVFDAPLRLSALRALWPGLEPAQRSRGVETWRVRGERRVEVDVHADHAVVLAPAPDWASSPRAALRRVVDRVLGP